MPMSTKCQGYDVYDISDFNDQNLLLATVQYNKMVAVVTAGYYTYSYSEHLLYNVATLIVI
jgi:hypothetical protein